MQTPFVDFVIRALDLLAQTTLAMIIGDVFIRFVSGERENFFTQFFDKATGWLYRIVDAISGGRARNRIVKAAIGGVLIFAFRIALNQIYIAIFGLPNQPE